MESLITAIPGWDGDAAFGFNQGTFVLLLIFFLSCFGIRMVLANYISKVFLKFGIKQKIAIVAIRDSSGTLGTAVSAGFMMVIIQNLMDTEQAKMPSLMGEVVLPVTELIFYFTLVFWAFRLVPAIYAIVDRFDGDGEMEGTTKTLISALESIMRFFIVAFGAVLIAGSLGFDLSAILAGLGISGIALALAAKDSVSNMFGAITVLLDRPFKVGDWVIIGSSEGEVIEINFRTTQIRTSIDSVVTFPNANLVNTPIENYGLRRWRRYQPILHLDLDSNPDSVEKFCNQVFDMIQSNEKTTKKEASSVRVQSLGPQAIDISCNLYWDTSSGTEEKELKQSFLLDIMRIAKQLDLHFFEPRLRRQE
ncbi:MAG: mechanosensitive ion channel family protein [Candidatus Thalassarchaeaceae archaeon]|nr:MAG: hypothetical protein CMA04_002625 [Euryarchaeota archaeon]RPG75384.1 MAG: mechanosensitive ion channel family protein [Euryarchaeota archaeon TMED85]|tara:strand:+ start:288 stop:1379 length:1092 start_codon:yes stop_codon:yes gene_type:complete